MGQTLGRWKIKDFLSSGGFGYVFLCEDVHEGIEAAIKILRIDAPAEQQIEFNTEGDLLHKLRESSSVVDWLAMGAEPIIVTVHGTGVAVPITARYLVLELAAGCLEELLAERHRLSWCERLWLYRGAVRGVHQMHINHIVHRDLKSSNCLLFVERNHSTTSKIADFGRARDLQQPTRFAAQDYLHGRGDLRFAPPEFLWFQGVDDPGVWKLADLYGLGSILFEVVTGQGITGVALGSGIDWARRNGAQPPSRRMAEFSSSIPDLRARYEVAFDMYAAEVPAVIRDQSLQLIRQLCDPDPARRLPRIGLGKRRHVDAGLQWLLNRVSIMIKTYQNAELQAARLHERKKQRNALGA